MAKVLCEANGKSFKIVIGEGKAPFKLLWISAAGEETRRTHHKSLELAYARARLWNENYPVVDATK